MEMEIEHPTHKKHLLTLHNEKRKKDDSKWCCLCMMSLPSTEYYYSCKRCTDINSTLCMWCAKLPGKIQHPFHPEHFLTLLSETPYTSGNSICNVCSQTCYNFIFNCSECQFDLDFNCAMLIPTQNKKKNYYSTSTSRDEEELDEQHITHPHPLIACQMKKEGLKFECCVCLLPIKKGAIYVCAECNSFFDRSCAELPKHITHHFHPHHSLTLKRFFDYPFSGGGCCDPPSNQINSRCKACPDFRGSFCYSCSESDCRFALDVRCASLMPKKNDNADRQEVVQVPSTNHAVLLSSHTKNCDFTFSCYICDLSIDGTVYVCLDGRFFLHQACAELPRQIKHPFHPQHALVLTGKSEDKYYECDACTGSDWGFKYGCEECNFAMDIPCALRSYSTFRFQIHQHPLALFNKGSPFFRCVPCKFTVENMCALPIRSTFKHSEHAHSLTLASSPIGNQNHSDADDEDDSEYYCDLCEEKRKLEEPTYYCKECPFVAQVSCVLDEILHEIEKERLLAQDKEIEMLQTEMDTLTARLETQTIKLDELNQKIPQHVGDSCQVGVMPVEIKNASAELNREIVVLQALTAKVEETTTKLNEVKVTREQYIEGIPSLGKKSPAFAVDNSDEMVEECYYDYVVAQLDCEIEAVMAKIETLKKKRACLV